MPQIEIMEVPSWKIVLFGKEFWLSVISNMKVLEFEDGRPFEICDWAKIVLSDAGNLMLVVEEDPVPVGLLRKNPWSFMVDGKKGERGVYQLDCARVYRFAYTNWKIPFVISSVTLVKLKVLCQEC